MSALSRVVIGSAFVFAAVSPAAPQSANRTPPATPPTNAVGTLAASPEDMDKCRVHCHGTTTSKQSIAERQARAGRCARTMATR